MAVHAGAMKPQDTRQVIVDTTVQPKNVMFPRMPSLFTERANGWCGIEPFKGRAVALHATAPPGNRYDGHTLTTIIPDMEKMIGNELSRILADAGCRGHNAPESHKLRVFTSGQKHRLTPAIKRQIRRRSAVEPVIGHLKSEHRMDRNYFAGEQGDGVNAVLAAAGYNFSLLLRWFRQLLCLLAALLFPFKSRPMRHLPAFEFFTIDSCSIRLHKAHAGPRCRTGLARRAYCRGNSGGARSRRGGSAPCVRAGTGAPS